MKISKSPGPDEIHPRVLYELRDIISLPLSIIFETSVNSGQMPDDWKIAEIVAIYKKGDKKIASNYRPVSLTSIVCKVLEKFIRDAIFHHMNTHNLFSSNQYGFICGRSTVLQLLTVIDKWTETIDNGGEVDVIYCDFMKAFDKVPHRRLIDKLKFYGFQGNLLNWIETFLESRKQRVAVNGEKSSWHDVLSGIPQGSVLGPVLFVIHINSLPETALNSEIYLFADDTKIFRSIKENNDQQLLQEDVNNMMKWSKQSMLKFHPGKCVSMTIGRKQSDPRKYYLGDESCFLEIVTQEKDIGVIIDNKLSFENHIINKVNKANSIMGIIRRTFNYLDKNLFLILFKTLVRPHIEYANQIWAPYLQKHITTLENVQRRATKQVIGLKELTYEQRLRTLNLPTLAYRRLRGDMIETYKILTGKYDTNVCKELFQITGTQNITRGHSLKIYKKQCKTNLRKFSFTFRTVDLWNSLPSYVVHAPNIITFENRLDKFFTNHPFKYVIPRATDLTSYYNDLMSEAPQSLLSEEDL